MVFGVVNGSVGVSRRYLLDQMAGGWTRDVVFLFFLQNNHIHSLKLTWLRGWPGPERKTMFHPLQTGGASHVSMLISGRVLLLINKETYDHSTREPKGIET